MDTKLKFWSLTTKRSPTPITTGQFESVKHLHVLINEHGNILISIITARFNKLSL